MPNQAGIEDHSARAEELASGYATIDREKIYPPAFLSYLEHAKAPLEILDVGAGAGNNAFYLANRGHHITAVEPSGLLEIAKRDHSHANITYLEDQLPGLSSQTHKYDVILLDSVWHYIDPAERAASLRRMAELLKPNGKLMVIYPSPPTREFQFDQSPAQFMQDVETVNAGLPKAQKLRPAAEPTVTRDMRQRKGLNSEDVHYNKFLLESPARAQTVSRRSSTKGLG